MEPTLRIAAAADVEALHTMSCAFHREDSIAVEPGTARRALEQLLSSPQLGQIWLICDRDQPVGYVVLTFGFSIEFGGRDAFVDELYIASRFRGRGWGRHTIDALAAKARDAGVHALHLEVTRGNNRALTLYKSAGYVEHDRYLMTKRLPE